LIRINVLGSAAGGGLPQWNCACANCAAARAGTIPSQAQSSIAVGAHPDDFQTSWLINASPDALRQIENTPQLRPRPQPLRNSRIAGILLTNADIDHSLGVLLLREQEKPLVVYAADGTRAALGWLTDILARFCGIEWRTISSDFQPLDGAVSFRGIKLSNSVAFQFRDDASRAIALFAPIVGELSEPLRDAVAVSDVVFFDGTFWSDHELAGIRPGARSARAMNHLPISDGSLDFLRQSPARRKIYTHINNTNPILMPGSRERAQIEQSGIEIAHDGMEIVL
jgi:pyrroloquinoline quinone biosynthesis protein B